MKPQIMNVRNPRWDEFLEKLRRKVNYRETKGGRRVSWNSKADSHKTFAIQIMKEMGGFDIDKTIEYFERYGGHCYCSILFNTIGRRRTSEVLNALLKLDSY